MDWDGAAHLLNPARACTNGTWFDLSKSPAFTALIGVKLLLSSSSFSWPSWKHTTVAPHVLSMLSFLECVAQHSENEFCSHFEPCWARPLTSWALPREPWRKTYLKKKGWLLWLLVKCHYNVISGQQRWLKVQMRLNGSTRDYLLLDTLCDLRTGVTSPCVRLLIMQRSSWPCGIQSDWMGYDVLAVYSSRAVPSLR